MEACYSVLHDIGNRCLRSLVGCGAIKASVALYMELPAASVGLPSSLSENDSNHPQSHAEDGSRMRFILYTEPDPSRAAYHAHTDAGLLTLALRSSAAALQVTCLTGDPLLMRGIGACACASRSHHAGHVTNATRVGGC